MDKLINKILKLEENELGLSGLYSDDTILPITDTKLPKEVTDFWNNSTLPRRLFNDYKGIVGKMITFGRDMVGINNSNVAVYTAVLDKSICPLCNYFHGMVFEVGSEPYKRFTPPLHNNCRCIFLFVNRNYMPQPKVNFKEPPKTFVDKHGQFILKNILSKD